MPISAGGTTVDLVNRMDEKPGSRNRKLVGVEHAQGLVGELVAWLNSLLASLAARISTDGWHVAGSEGEGILPGIRT